LLGLLETLGTLRRKPRLLRIKLWVSKRITLLKLGVGKLLLLEGGLLGDLGLLKLGLLKLGLLKLGLLGEARPRHGGGTKRL